MNEIQLIFNNRNMNDLIFIRAVRGRGIVGYEIEETEKNQADGAFLRYKKRPPRRLEVDVTVLSDSPEELRDNIDKINGILKTSKEVPIRFTDEPNITYYGTLSEATQSEEIVSLSNETITLYCSDPDKIGEERQTVQTEKEIQITNNGTAKTPPYIKAVLQEDASQIDFTLNDEMIRLHYDFTSNDIVEIDFDKEKVYINGSEQMTTIDLFYANFFKLDTGSNTLTTEPLMQLDIKHNERWL